MRLPAHTARTAVIVLSLLGAGFFGAYLRFLPYLQTSANYTDGSQTLELSDLEQLRFAVWDDPVPLPPAINTTGHEGRATVSPDGRLLVFASGEPGLNVDLWVADLVDDQPVDPRPLDLLNTSADELSPAFGPHGLWFASNRAGGAGGFDILFAPWNDGQLERAERLPPGLNGDFDELDPAPVPGSGALAFASDRPRGRRHDLDLYLAVPGPPGHGPVDASSAWTLAPLQPLNTPFDEREPSFTADGLGLLLASDRDGGEGGFDLYRSLQSFGEWLEPEALSGINSADHERAPMASADGFTLLFSRGQPADLSRARSLELFRMEGRPLGWLDLTILAVLLLIALLAWLGRRWEALDILYKCLLVSLLVHVALMLWFREVTVENEPVPVEKAAPTFKVRLTASRSQQRQNQRRDGEVSADPVARLMGGAPERASTQSAEPAAARSAQQASLAVPEVDSAPAAERAQGQSARADVQAEHVVAYQDAAAASPLMSGEAVSMALPSAHVTRGEQHDAMSATAPQRASVDAVAGASRTRAMRTGRPSLTVPAVTSGAGLPGPATPLDPIARASGGQPSPSIEVAAPAGQAAGQITAHQAEAPAFSVAGLAPQETTVATQRSGGAARPTRQGRSADVGGTSSTASGAARPAPLPAIVSAATERTALQTTRQGDGAQRGPQHSERPAIALADGVANEMATGLSGDLSSAANDSSAGAATEQPSHGGQSERALDLGSLAAVEVSAPRGARLGAARPGRLSTVAPSAPAARPALRPLAALTTLAVAQPETSASDYEHTPYRTRFGEAKIAALAEHGGTVETEQAVAAGLAYLARQQRPEGHWGSPDDFDDKYGHVSVGKTGLSLLAFLGAGHAPGSRREHAQVAARARDFLLGVQDEQTGHFGYSTSYSHAIATYALSECYALTRNDDLRGPLEHAVAWIVSQQDHRRNRRRLGGWGYYYPDGRTYDSWPRTSVTSWQVMALESAQLAGLDVPAQVFDDARTFLLNAQDSGRQTFTYSRDPERLNGAYPYLPGSTPAGLFALSLLGEDLDEPLYAPNLRFLLERAPTRFEEASSDGFVNRAEGNLYFWYYASLVLFRQGGDAWETWNRHLQSTLLPNQRADGSWEPISLYADYAGDSRSDRSYTTAMCVLTLEVYYRYFTPLLKVR